MPCPASHVWADMVRAMAYVEVGVAGAEVGVAALQLNKLKLD